MKTLTLYPLWATLIAVGAKKVETRGWATTYRGEFLVHSAKAWGAKQADIGFAMLYWEGLGKQWTDVPALLMLSQAGYKTPDDLPRGCIVAKARLVDCVPTEHMRRVTFAESEFGDFTPGRFAWVLEDVQPIVPTIPALGKQGWWDFEIEGDKECCAYSMPPTSMPVTTQRKLWSS